MSSNKFESKPWLIIMPNNPGDVMMALQVAGEIKFQNPNQILEFIVDSESASLLENHPWIDKSHIIQRKKLKGLFEGDANVFSVLEWENNFLEPLIDTEFQRVINLFQDPYAAYLVGLLNSKDKRGLQIDERGNLIIKDRPTRYLFSIPADRSLNPMHVVDIYKAIAGVKSTGAKFLNTGPLKDKYLNTHCHFDLNIKNTPFYALQIGSAWPGKKWSFANWVELVKKIDKPLVLIGAPNEFEEAENLSQYNNQIINLVGKTSLCQILGILNQAELLITGDTFAMHAAAAVGCQCLCLFGPSNPIETGPYGAGHLILSHSFDLSENLDLKSDIKINKITPSEVLSVIGGTLPLNTKLRHTYYNAKSGIQELKSLGNLETKKDHPYDDLFYKTIFKEHLNSQIEKIQTYFSSKDSKLLTQLEICEKNFYEKHKNHLCVEEFSLLLNSIPLRNLEEYLIERKEAISKLNSLENYTWLKRHLTSHHNMAPGSKVS